MRQNQQSEPPSWLRPPLFVVGQNTRGNWVVQDQKGMRGGLFVNREAAVCDPKTDLSHKQWSWFRAVSSST